MSSSDGDAECLGDGGAPLLPEAELSAPWIVDNGMSGQAHSTASMSSRRSSEREPGAITRHQALQRSKADIPPIDPNVLKDLEILAQDVALKVDQMMKSLNGTIQNMTALSVGYIQTYRDSVDSLGESVDMSIKGMYTLMARCEELDRSMQPIHSLAKQIREIKRSLEMFEMLCK